MTVIFIGIILAIFLGSICLWNSGRLIGRRFVAKEISSQSHTNIINQATEQITKLSKNLDIAKDEIQQFKTESSKYLSQQSIAETESERLKQETEELKQEIEELKQEIESARNRGKPNIPKPTRGMHSVVNHESEVFDNIQVELDLEKIAHQKTRDELEQIKKIASIKSNNETYEKTTDNPVKKLRLQPDFISTRDASVRGAEHDRLRQLHERLKREKEMMESELFRTKQELQLLKMRPK